MTVGSQTHGARVTHTFAGSFMKTRIGVGADEPAPFHGEPVKTDSPVQLDAEERHEIERPPAAAPDAVGRRIRADVARVHHHLVKVHRDDEEERVMNERAAALRKEATRSGRVRAA